MILGDATLNGLSSSDLKDLLCEGFVCAELFGGSEPRVFVMETSEFPTRDEVDLASSENVTAATESGPA